MAIDVICARALSVALALAQRAKRRSIVHWVSLHQERPNVCPLTPDWSVAALRLGGTTVLVRVREKRAPSLGASTPRLARRNGLSWNQLQRRKAAMERVSAGLLTAPSAPYPVKFNMGLHLPWLW